MSDLDLTETIEVVRRGNSVSHAGRMVPLSALFDAIEAAARADERERIVKALRARFGATNRAAAWIARGATDA